MKRLITTGCSFTNYLPPTWPWFLSEKFNETYNLGKPGAGNEYIFNSLIDADTLLRFGEHDTIIVMWTGFFRIDRSGTNENWKSTGDITSWPIQDYEYFSKYFSENFLTKRSINFILATYRYLKSKSLNFYFSSMQSLKDGNNFYHLLNEIFDENFIIDNIANVITENRNPLITQTWGHPTPLEHYEIAKKFSKKIGITLDTTFDFENFMISLKSENDYHKLLNQPEIASLIYSRGNIGNAIHLDYGHSHLLKLTSSSLKNLEKLICGA